VAEWRTRAQAKINLTLHVTGRRTDGYHDLESLVVFAGVHDDLTFTPGDDWGLSVKGPMAAFCGPAEDNLILKAAWNLAALWPKVRPGHFALTKRLPAQAGIGGGSADAAAALRLLAASAGSEPPGDDTLRRAAVSTGADVAVCLLSKAQMMRGLGDQLEPVGGLPGLFAVLVNPGAKVETKAAFARFGLKPGDRRSGAIHPVIDAAAFHESLAKGRNDFEPIALETAPAVGEALKALRHQASCQLARMSGSGSTCFGLFPDCHSAAQAARRMKAKHLDWWIVPTLLR
jgi:4-diphosphocytidyl-2-C-methyl-D-erythritol kinase